VHAKQKLSPPRSRGPFFLGFLLGFLFACVPFPSRADSLEDAARALARKAASVPQRDRRVYLDWQNHASVAAEQSEALRESFTNEFGNENVAATQESGLRALRVSVEQTPALLILVASVPCANGEEVRIMESPRAALATVATSAAPPRLLKELLWQQPEPILDAIEPGDEINKQSLLLLLDRENISLYRRESDHWELLDTKPIHASEKPVRDLRGELQFSPGRDNQHSVALPGQTCDLGITEKIELNCHPGTPTWREGLPLASPCDRGVSWLRAESGDWSVPDRLLLGNRSLPRAVPSIAELNLPGPVISISSGQAMQSDTASVFNLSTGNYEVYRITLACGN
jgi:hypothetical protein